MAFVVMYIHWHFSLSLSLSFCTADIRVLIEVAILAQDMFLRVIVALLCAAAAFGKPGAGGHGNDKCSRAWSYASAAELFA